MRNLLFLALLISFSSCEKEEKACYIFTITRYTDVNPDPMNEYPKTTVDEYEECDINEETAKNYKNDWMYEDTDTISSYIIYYKNTSTYRKK